MSRLPETVVVGRIGRPHGLRGEVAIDPMSDNEERFAAGAELQAGREGRWRTLTILNSRPHGDRVLVTFVGIDDRDAAKELGGSELRVRLDEVPPAAEGEYYHFELLDCVCVDRTEGELGRVASIVEDGGGLLLEVVREGSKVSVPFVRSFLVAVDVEGGRIDVDLPPGLVELCTSTS